MNHATRLRSIFGGSAGNLVEWYDWYVYSAFALWFGIAASLVVYLRMRETRDHSRITD